MTRQSISFFLAPGKKISCFEVIYVCFVDEDQRRGNFKFSFSPLFGHDGESSNEIMLGKL